MRKIILCILAGLFLMCSCTVFAAFIELNKTTFGPNQYGGNWDDTFKDHGIEFNIAYKNNAGQNQRGQFIVKKKGKEIFRHDATIVSPLLIKRIQNTDDGRIFYLINGCEYGGYLMGYDSAVDKWQVYANVLDYYCPFNAEYRGIALENGEIIIFQETPGPRNFSEKHYYKLYWNSAANWFGYSDLGENRS